ncbi:hypothetical protein Ocin01_15527 [Orchesella cincta]|uniref:Uncharacterized protein n=1 Tax=Orchesella cincta TaxID=48709 RepID=A0A1D2MDR1_ORCCI|nr:hypothetical protein Ocin01_15527 [Orchesella cincta]
MSKMLTHICHSCGYKSKYSYEWNNHLLDYRHQCEARTSFLKWSHDNDVKSFVVYAHVDDKPMVVAEKFRSVSHIVDFVFWSNRPGLFIVQLETQEDADALLHNLRMNPDDMKIGGRDIQLRRKSDVLQNEWTLLIGYGVEREGSSNDPICVEISDENSGDGVEMRSNITEESFKTEEEQNGNGSMEQEELTFELNTKMSSHFSKIFLSKLKPEKRADNKENVKENVRFMGKTWMDMYLDFNNLIWPVCFTIKNTNVVCEKSCNDKCQTKEISFHGECLSSESKDNEWLAKSKSICKNEDVLKQFVLDKVNEYYEVLINETECNSKLDVLSQCSPRDKRLLNFSCSITISCDSKGATADISFTNIEGKSIESKMTLVTSIFKKLFKKYEKMRIEKWSLAESQSLTNGVVRCSNWKHMGPKD